jgi:truncated hemoglobin YjbI
MGEHQRRKETPKKAREKRGGRKNNKQKSKINFILPRRWLRCLSETHREAKKKSCRRRREARSRATQEEGAKKNLK